VEQKLTTIKNYVIELEGKFRNGDISISEYDRSIIKNNDVYNEVLGEVSPLHSALNKVENIYAYIAPYITMLQPQRMFPVTYRDHEVSKTPVDLSSVKNADTYRKLAHENQATDAEEAALEKYLLGVESGDSNNTFDPDDLEDLDDRPMGYWDKVKVQGGNSRLSGTPDGFAGPATATFDYFSEDLFTMFDPNASMGEKMLASVFILPTPAKFLKPLDDVASGLKKGKSSNKASGTKNSFDELMSPEEATRYNKYWESRTWSLSENGAVINRRRYTIHALERMAPDIPQVRAILNSKAQKTAVKKGMIPGTRDYKNFINDYSHVRNIPPLVIEDAVINGTKKQGNILGTWAYETVDVKVIVNYSRDIVTVIPK